MKFEVSAMDFPDFLARLPATFFVVLPWLALHHMTTLRERSYSAFLLFAFLGMNDCFRFPMSVRWCIKVRDKHVQNAISSVFPEIPDKKITTFSAGVDIPSVSST